MDALCQELAHVINPGVPLLQKAFERMVKLMSQVLSEAC